MRKGGRNAVSDMSAYYLVVTRVLKSSENRLKIGLTRAAIFPVFRRIAWRSKTGRISDAATAAYYLLSSIYQNSANIPTISLTRAVIPPFSEKRRLYA